MAQDNNNNNESVTSCVQNEEYNQQIPYLLDKETSLISNKTPLTKEMARV